MNDYKSMSIMNEAKIFKSFLFIEKLEAVHWLLIKSEPKASGKNYKMKMHEKTKNLSVVVLKREKSKYAQICEECYF